MALADVVKTLKKEQKKLAGELSRITEMIKAAGAGVSAGVREYRRRGRKRRAGRPAGTATVTPRKPMSAAARKKIAAAQRKRWAKVKAAKKAA
jgi:hypothetical protein